MMLGIKKEDVAKFSFLMVLVPVLGEAFLELMSGEFSVASAEMNSLPLILGFISAFISGLFACKFMIAIVKRAKLKYFAIYCAVAGLFCLASLLF